MGEPATAGRMARAVKVVSSKLMPLYGIAHGCVMALALCMPFTWRILLVGGAV